MFFDFDNDLHTYYVVEDGKVLYMPDRVRETSLPERLGDVKQFELHSVHVFIHEKVPISIRMDAVRTRLQAVDIHEMRVVETARSRRIVDSADTPADVSA